MSRRNKFLLTALVLAILLSSSCDLENPSGNNPGAVTGVKLDTPTLSLIVGGEAVLTATVTPSTAKNTSVTWSSSAPSIATVTNGVVRAVAAGSATITVTTESGGKTATCAVSVSPTEIPVASVSLSSTSINLAVGGSQTLVAIFTPANATNKRVTWDTSAPSIATVTDGVVRAVAAGTATITVTTEDGGKTAACAVSVSATEVPVSGVNLSTNAVNLSPGGSQTLVATVLPNNATNKNVIWNSNDPSVATVAEGLVTGVSSGTATITVTTQDGGKTAICAVTVTGGGGNVAVTGVTLNKPSTSLVVGNSETLSATVAPTNATNKAVSWTSNNTAVATVSGGTVSAVAEGSATITVTTQDGNKSATCAVSVTSGGTGGNVAVSGVTLNKTSVSLTVGGIEALSATVAPANATNKAVSWTSNNTAVATVSGGTVFAVAAGNATITVTTQDGNKTATCSVTVTSGGTGGGGSYVRIDGGTFLMGSPSTEASRGSDETQHQVTVSGFYIGKNPVTQAEYQSLMGTNPSNFKGADLPVDQVLWSEAVEYCNRLSQQEGLTPVYSSSGGSVSCNWNASGYRLPTEAEWEYACRAGTTTAYSTGSAITTGQANFSGNGVNRTTPVESYSPNSWGLYDMHGNISEWCWDWYGDYSSGAQTNPHGAVTGTNKVLRGGYWDSAARYLRSAARGKNFPSTKHNGIGFRVARN